MGGKGRRGARLRCVPAKRCLTRHLAIQAHGRCARRACWCGYPAANGPRVRPGSYIPSRRRTCVKRGGAESRRSNFYGRGTEPAAPTVQVNDTCAARSGEDWVGWGVGGWGEGEGRITFRANISDESTGDSEDTASLGRKKQLQGNGLSSTPTDTRHLGLHCAAV